MPLNDTGLVLGDIRDGQVVIKVINAAAGEYHWKSATQAGTVFTGSTTAAAGVAGAVAVPPVDSQNKVLRGGGSFTDELSAWATAVDYEVGDVVVDSGSIFKANTAHTAAATFAADAASWDAIGGGGSIFTGDITADAAHTHALGSHAQTWDNLGTWDIDQEIAGFPGAYLPTTIATARLQVAANGAPGTTGTLDVQPNSVELGSVSGTETRQVLLGVAGSSLIAQSTSGGSTEDTEVAARVGMLEFNLGTTADMRVNTDPGAANEVLTSQGPNLPPIWGTGTTPMVGADATTIGEAGTVPAPAIGAQDLVLHGDGLFRQAIPNWTTSTDYSQGAIVYQGQQIWRRTAAGTSGLTFDAAEEAAWVALADNTSGPFRQSTAAAAWVLNGTDRELTITQATHGFPAAGSYLIQTFDATTPAAQVAFTPDSVAVNSTTGDITISVADGSEVDVAVVVFG